MKNYQKKRIRCLKLLKKKNDDVQKNLDEFNKKQEEERLRLEEDTFLRSNYNNILNYNIL